MKKTIRIIAALALSLVSLTAGAQLRWAGAVGVNVNNLKFKQDLVTVDKSMGASAGLVGELMFPGIGFGLDLGLLYNMQGADVNLGEREVWASIGAGKEKVMIHNLNIPLHLRFKYTRLGGFEDKVAPFVFGGPEFNLQIAHNNGDLFKYSGGDLGLTAGGGVELFKRWQVSVAYTWGMTYVCKTKLLDNFSAQSRQLRISALYFF